MSLKHILATTAVAAVTTTGVAAAADAPTISAQKTLTSKFAPVTIGGPTGVKKGDRLPSGARLIYRDVTILKGQKPTATLLAPKGKLLKNLASPEGQDVGFVVVKPRPYTGHRRVQVRFFAGYTPDKTKGDTLTGRIYALVR